MKLFEIFDISTDFLNKNPVEWDINASYRKGKSVHNSINKVVKDAAEKDVKLISNFEKVEYKNHKGGRTKTIKNNFRY